MTNAKCKICRREGKKLFLKGERCYSPKCPFERKKVAPPGMHGRKRRRRPSKFSEQLREKQKAKRLYGLRERQFKKYFDLATQEKNTGETLIQLLESRLDNVVYRLGLASSRGLARQLVSHGHIKVDGQKMDLPSYQVKPGQTVTLTPRGLEIKKVIEMVQNEDYTPPSWLKRKAAVGKMVKLPQREDLDVDLALKAIMEYYSR